MEDASRFGLVITDENNQILEFEEKPANPRSNKASMGIYIFNWEVLKEALETLSEQPGCDFGMHVIPYCHPAAVIRLWLTTTRVTGRT